MKNKNLIFLVLTLLMSPIVIFSQTNDPCNANWAPDHILNAPSSTYPSSYFVGKKLELREGFIIDNDIEFNNSKIKVSVFQIKVQAGQFKIKNSSLFKACNIEWIGFAASQSDTEVENSFFYNFYGHLFSIGDKKFHFHNNYCFSQQITGGSAFQFRGQTDDFSFYGNNVVTNSSPFHVVSSKALTIGNYSKNPNIFNTYEQGIWQNKLNTNLTLVNSNFYFVGFALDSYKAKVDKCEFYKKDTDSNILSFAISSILNLDVSNCKFYYCPSGIIHKGTYMNINNNLFSTNGTAIKTELASQNFGNGFIEGNTFTYNRIDIHTKGASAELSIEHNNFSGSDYGILADGDSNYSITKNSFYNSYAGAIAYSNGTNTNLNDGNQYYTLIGMHALENNGGFQFLDNCFGTSGGDIYLDGTISDMIGLPQDEAGNCFTKGGTPDITAVTNLFKYFRPDSEIGTCNDPVTQGNYDEKDAVSTQIEPCGSNTPYSGTKRNYCKFNFKTLSCVDAKKLLADIEKDILIIDPKTKISTSTAYEKAVFENILKNLLRCKSKLLKFIIGCADKLPNDPKFPDGDGSDSSWTGNEPALAANALKTSLDKYDRAAYIGITISSGRYAEAKAFILEQAIEDQEMEDFKNVQMLNIKRYEEGDLFQATDTELNLLLNIAQKSDPLATYARSLYAHLTGETIYPYIPRITFNRSAKVNISSSEIVISPNPVSDLLNIKINNLEPQNIQVFISDITGKTIDQFNVISNHVDVNTSHWPNGIYFVKVQYDSGYSETKRVAKQ